MQAAAAHSAAVVRFPATRARKAGPNFNALEGLLKALDITIIPTNQTRRANATAAKGRHRNRQFRHLESWWQSERG
jgi:hypothetical protein